MFPKIGVFPPNHPILIEFSIINHPFWGTPIFENTHISYIPKKLQILAPGPVHSQPAPGPCHGLQGWTLLTHSERKNEHFPSRVPEKLPTWPKIQTKRSKIPETRFTKKKRLHSCFCWAWNGFPRSSGSFKLTLWFFWRCWHSNLSFPHLQWRIRMFSTNPPLEVSWFFVKRHSRPHI